MRENTKGVEMHVEIAYIVGRLHARVNWLKIA